MELQALPPPANWGERIRGWKGRLAGLALVSAAREPVDGRPLARPAVGSRARRRRAPDPLNLFVYDVFWLLSSGLYVPAPTRLAPSGGLRAENS